MNTANANHEGREPPDNYGSWGEYQNAFCKQMKKFMGKSSEDPCQCSYGFLLLGASAWPWRGYEWVDFPPSPEILHGVDALLGPNGFTVFKMLQARLENA